MAFSEAVHGHGSAGLVLLKTGYLLDIAVGFVALRWTANLT